GPLQCVEAESRAPVSYFVDRLLRMLSAHWPWLLAGLVATVCLLATAWYWRNTIRWDMVLQMGRVLSIILIIAFLTLPASNWSTHAHWKKIEWVPFRGRVSGLDVLENVLLFFPFGFLHACTVPPRPALRFWRLLFLGAALSTAGECFQIFCHNRFSSTTD